MSFEQLTEKLNNNVLSRIGALKFQFNSVILFFSDYTMISLRKVISNVKGVFFYYFLIEKTKL